jgi:hypothetical protein
MTLMDNAVGFLGTAMKSFAGRSVTIRQGTTHLTGLTAVREGEDVEVVDADGFLTKVAVIIWTFVKEDLSGLQLRAGGVITDVSEDAKYEIVPVGNKAAVEDDDKVTAGIRTKVRTKKIS